MRPNTAVPDPVEHTANQVMLGMLRKPKNQGTKRLGPAPDLFFKEEPDKNIYDRYTALHRYPCIILFTNVHGMGTDSTANTVVSDCPCL